MKRYKHIPVAFAQLIINHPRIHLLFVFFIVAAIAPFIGTIQSRFSPRMWFDDGHPEIKRLDAFEKRFGNDQKIVVVLHHEKGIFQKPIIEAMKTITDQLWSVPDIIRVESLSNYNTITGQEDEILIAPLIPEDAILNTNFLKLKQAEALKDEVIPNYLLSKDATTTLIYGQLRPSIESDPRYPLIVQKTEELLTNFRHIEGLRFFLLGDAPGNTAFKEISASDNIKIVPFMVGFIIILLLLLFRSRMAVILPLLLAVLTIATTFGLLGALNFTFTSLLAAIPGILLAICLADSIHILASYYHFFRIDDFSARQAIEKSLIKNFGPTILTSISTAISFFSIMMTDISPVRALGCLAGIGTLLAWLFTYWLLGPIIVIFANRLDHGKTRKKAICKNTKEQRTIAYANFIYRWRFPIIIVFSLTFTVCLYLSSLNQVNSDPLKYFDTSVPIRKSSDFVSTKLDAMRGIEFVVDSGKNDGIKDPQFLRKLDDYLKWMLRDDDIVQARSVLDIIKKMNRTLNEGKQEFYSIPPLQTTVAELLFLYTMGLPQGMDLNNQFSLDHRYLRLRIIWKITTSKEAELKNSLLINEAEKRGLIVSAEGNVPMYLKMNQTIVSSFFKAMAMALVLVCFLIFCVFRDFKISLLSIFPNIIPLSFGGAIMYAKGTYIDIGTSLVATVCLGIAVDDTIHFVVNFKMLRQRGYSIYDAIKETFAITGMALMTTTVILVVGFGSFIFADFIPNQNFGILCAIVLLLALITDLIFLPAILFLGIKNGK